MNVIAKIIIAILISNHALAHYLPEFIQDQPWSISASVGNGKYPQVNSLDNTPALGRLALANDLLLSGDIALGFELGLQNGHNIQLDIPDTTLAVLKWIPTQTTLGPMLDLLITAKSDPLYGSDFFAQLKGGIAYRRWKIEQKSVEKLSQLAGEIQAGFGYPITTLANLSLLYQGIFGSDPQIRFDAHQKKAHVSNIPILHAILFGLSVNL